MEDQVQAIKAAGPDDPSLDSKAKTCRPIFHDLIFNSDLSEAEKSVRRLGEEGSLLVIAGSETVANALTHLHYHLLANPEKLAKLKQELQDHGIGANGTRPTWQQLKPLPYLTACIDEILRLANTVTHRLGRIVSEQGLQYGQYQIPAGVRIFHLPFS